MDEETLDSFLSDVLVVNLMQVRALFWHLEADSGKDLLDVAEATAVKKSILDNLALALNTAC